MSAPGRDRPEPGGAVGTPAPHPPTPGVLTAGIVVGLSGLAMPWVVILLLDLVRGIYLALLLGGSFLVLLLGVVAVGLAVAAHDRLSEAGLPTRRAWLAAGLGMLALAQLGYLLR